MSKEAVEQARKKFWGAYYDIQILVQHPDWTPESSMYEAVAELEAAIREDAVREWREAVQEWVEYERADAHRDLGGRCDQDAQPWPCPAFTLRALLDREKEG